MKKYLLIIPVTIILICALVLLLCNEPTIPVDKEFLKGDWVDEQGYILNINDDKADIYIDTGKYNVTYENGTATLRDASDVIRITGRDENTIIIDGANIKKCYAYRESSEKGKEVCKEVKKRAEGCWKSNQSNEFFVIINSEKIISIVSGNETVINNDADSIRLASFEELQDSELEISLFPAIRLDGEDMLLHSTIYSLRFKKSDIDKVQEELDLNEITAEE